MKNSIKIFVVIAVIFGWGTQAYAWCGKYTHTSLTEKAISNNNQSVLDEYLKGQLDVEQGLGCELSLDQSTIPESDRIPSDQLEDRISSILPSNPSVLDLLKVGSELEDIPLPRSRHHFHDPYRNRGLENKTEHPALTHEALQVGNDAAKIDEYLKTQMGLEDGLNTKLEWVFPADIKE